MVAPRTTIGRIGLVAALVLPGAAAFAFPAVAAPQSAAPRMQAEDRPFAVPAAECGPGSRPETGLQGQVPLVDQVNGRSMEGYQCNLELVGQYTGDGGAIMMAWKDDCAYMPTGYSFTDPEFQQRKGVVVIDASDPASPQEVRRLQTPAMVNPWESLKVSETRGLLAAGEGGSFPFTGEGSAGPGFDVYDVNADCKAPELQASVDLPDTRGHEGDFTPDGLTYWQSSNRGAPNSSVVAIDVSDPKNPKQLGAYPIEGGIHGLQFSDDGMLGYFMANNKTNGLMIFDTSDVQLRRPDPQIRLLSHLRWEDNSLTQIGRLVTIGGKRYLIGTDEFGASISPQQSCREGKPPWGYTRIIDIADPTKPVEVSQIKLEVNDPANCATTLQEQNSAFALMYSAHYCNADDPKDTKYIACGWISSGLRVFDVRDPQQPREVAYYMPPARLDTARGTFPWFGEAFTGSRTKDGVGSQVRWKRAADGSMHLWFISGLNGFQIVKFTNNAYSPQGATPVQNPPANAPSGSVPPDAVPPAGAPPAAVPTMGSSTRGALAATGLSTSLPWAALALAVSALAVLSRRKIYLRER